MDPLRSPLLTDLYQLTMLHTYYRQRMEAIAVFEFFVRKLPSNRNFMMAAGLEQVLDFLEQARFGPEELDWVARSGLFTLEFVKHLEQWRFAGDVHAMPEGTVFFPDEPILRVTAPMPQAQLVESRLINLIHFESLVATKAARGVLVAPGKKLVDFGLRRAHGAEAGLLAARAAYIAGYASTATVLAGSRFGIPVVGTMAHSFVQAHDDEAQAFLDFARAFPKGTVFLVDTYDTEAGVRKVAALAPQLGREGIAVQGVRLDSGDLLSLARSARRILDDAGLRDTVIFASGNLDEYRLRELLEAGAPIDGFGVGTSLVTSADAPYLDAVYKLQEYAGRPRRKRSTAKATWPGRKQVFRVSDRSGLLGHDIVTVEGDTQDGEPLLIPVMQQGRRLGDSEPLDRIRAHAAAELARLPRRVADLETASEPYRVDIAPALRRLAEEVDRATAEPTERVSQGL
ncbi:MAG: nicotinate phosphoribosyltransferase [Betaproteobacteria bacterium]|nr:nicotinate phosphoribosyltransferase [Betaproteobacteria bacterium]MDH3435554.1 nicotinate phosphoribosyltransferase [Betaproteobacteria bacterium]